MTPVEERLFHRKDTSKSHKNKVFVFSVCGKSFASKIFLDDNEELKPYICEVRGKGFMIKHSLKVHTKKRLTSVKSAARVSHSRVVGFIRKMSQNNGHC